MSVGIDVAPPRIQRGGGHWGLSGEFSYRTRSGDLERRRCLPLLENLDLRLLAVPRKESKSQFEAEVLL